VKFGLELHPNKTRLIEFGRFAFRDRERRGQYRAVPGNSSQLRLFRRRVCRLWRSTLVRRSQRAQVRWERLVPLMDRWIPLPRILHPHPNHRFYAIHSE